MRGQGKGQSWGGCTGQGVQSEQPWKVGGREHRGPLEKAGGGKAGHREEMKKLGLAGKMSRKGGRREGRRETLTHGDKHRQRDPRPS